MTLIIVGAIVLFAVVSLVVGAYRYGTRTIHPEDIDE